MFRRSFTAPPAPSRPLVVVGDIHGRADLLDRLLAIIEAETPAAADLVFVGDYVDRGPDSRAVLDRLASLVSGRARTTCLRGNHETMLLDFLHKPESAQVWLRNGGGETLASFGLPNLDQHAAPEALRDAASRLHDLLAPVLLPFLHGLALSFSSGNIFVAHAGADPDRPVIDQAERDLIWGHPKFRRRPRRDGIWVAHGHWPDPTPDAEDGRIAVDTGAFFSDRLTAALVGEGQTRFLSAGP